MRLTTKLVVWFFLCALIALGLNGYYGVRTELIRYESDVAQHHVVMGRVLRAAFAEVMDTDGEAHAVDILEHTDKRIRLVDIRWVHLEHDAPPKHRPSAPLSRLAPLSAGDDVHHKGDDGTLRSYVPLMLEGRSTSALEFSERLEGSKLVVRHAIARELRTVSVVAIAIGIAAAFLGILLVARPMRVLIEHARRIGRGDFSPAADSTAKDEISQLAREMNAMCRQLANAEQARLAALEQVRHAERLTTVGKLASGLAHEFGTPLNVITLRANAIAQGRAIGERAHEAAVSISEQATRMTDLVRQLLDFARRKVPARTAVDVEAVVRRSADLVDTIARKANVSFAATIKRDELPALSGDPVQLEQVLTNLLMNAIHAMPAGGTVSIDAEASTTTPPLDHPSHPLGPGRFVRVSVGDRGIGIPPETLPHIFEPFFTTKAVGDGTGLGLAVCYGIVRDHGGWIDVDTQVGVGTTVSVYLPEEET